MRAKSAARRASSPFARPKSNHPTIARTIRTTPAVKVRSFPPDRPMSVNRPMMIPKSDVDHRPGQCPERGASQSQGQGQEDEPAEEIDDPRDDEDDGAQRAEKESEVPVARARHELASPRG